jgi:methylglutaconyl-CoA hydratase
MIVPTGLRTRPLKTKPRITRYKHHCAPISFNMRQRLNFLPCTLPKQLIRRAYSSTSTPLVNITDVKAPTGGGRIRILSLARPSARNAISRQLLWELRSHIEAVAGEYDVNGEEVPPQKRFGGAVGVDERGPTRALILASEVSSARNILKRNT